MAHLNVRDHRIEAKIAYVGPTPDGIALTFDRLRDEPTFSIADDVTLEWRPVRSKRFRDCDVVVKVVAPRDEHFEDVLQDADGIVFVGDPAAEEKNRAYLSAIHDHLARVARPRTPVLVQEQEVATLEDALGEILAAMDTPATPVATDDRTAAHPLLNALRQVLKETVREHVDEIAARLEAKIDASFADVKTRLEAVETQTAALASQANAKGDDALILNVIQTLEETDLRLRELTTTLAAMPSHDDLAQVSTRVDRAFTTATASIKKSVDGVTGEVTKLEKLDVRGPVRDVAEQLRAAADSVDAVMLRIQRFDAFMKRIEKVEESIGVFHNETTDRSNALNGRVTELIEELKKPKKGWFT